MIPLVFVVPDGPRRAIRRWRKLRGLLSGIKAGAQIGIRVPDDEVSSAYWAIYNTCCFERMYVTGAIVYAQRRAPR